MYQIGPFSICFQSGSVHGGCAAQKWRCCKFPGNPLKSERGDARRSVAAAWSLRRPAVLRRVGAAIGRRGRSRPSACPASSCGKPVNGLNENTVTGPVTETRPGAGSPRTASAAAAARTRRKTAGLSSTKPRKRGPGVSTFLENSGGENALLERKPEGRQMSAHGVSRGTASIYTQPLQGRQKSPYALWLRPCRAAYFARNPPVNFLPRNCTIQP